MSCVVTVPQSELPEHQRWIEPYMGEFNLNVGAGNNPLPGFRNLQQSEWWLGEYSAPFSENRADCIVASHVMEHVTRIIPAMRDIHRVLKPGGFFIAITPYASSNDAVEDPTHVRYFTEMSWQYFNESLYKAGGHAGSYKSAIDFTFTVESVALVPYPEFHNDAELDFKMKHWRNVIKEMHAVLRKA